METVASCGVNGLCKLFLYEHFIVRRLSWVFLVHDLNLWFAKELDKRVIPRLKEWAGLYRSSDIGTLFRLREHLGLQLTSVEHHYEHLQLVKCCLLENSKDDNVRALYKLREESPPSHAVGAHPMNYRRSNPSPTTTSVLQVKPAMLASAAKDRTRTSRTQQWRNVVGRSLIPSPPNTKKTIFATPPASLVKASGPTGTMSFPSTQFDPWPGSSSHCLRPQCANQLSPDP